MSAPTDRAGVVRVMAEGLWPRGVPEGPCNATEDARIALAAIEAAGLRVVPVEATEEMAMAALGTPVRVNRHPADAYRDMLAASPFAPPQETE